jgi:hypothetical protein
MTRSSLVPIVVLSALLPASAGAAVVQGSTSAGKRLAGEALLRRTDLGRGWSAGSPPPRKLTGLTCPQFNPPIEHVVQTGGAQSPTYQRSASGPFLSETAYVYATAAQRSAVWTRIARPNLARCVADAFVQSSADGVSFTVIRKGTLGLPKLPAEAVGYRVSGTASTSRQTVDVYLDLVVLGSGRSLSALSISSFQAPVARRAELRLAQSAARRLLAAR